MDIKADNPKYFVWCIYATSQFAFHTADVKFILVSCTLLIAEPVVLIAVMTL